MRLICDGVVERDGVDGLAGRLGYTPRHLQRLLVAELGAGPLALARARRAHNARTLIETTAMPFADVAFAAGFASVRQFNDTVREVYAGTPTQLRQGARGRAAPSTTAGPVELRLPVRSPFAAGDLLRFLAAHVVPDVEQCGPDWYERTLSLPHGAGRVRLSFGHDRYGPATAAASYVSCSLELADLRDVGTAVERCRRLVDADADPVAVDAVLGADPFLAPLLRRRPGLRVPGSVDGDEVAIRAVLGQQVSVAAGTSLAATLVQRYGAPAGEHSDGPTRLFPGAATLAEVDPGELPMPRARGRAVVALCRALAAGDVRLDRGADRASVRADLLALPGIGPWTAGYVAMRALGDPDVFLPADVGVRRAVAALGRDPDGSDPARRHWRPWRSYALMHLWSTLDLRPRPRASEPRQPGD
jgi:AraC family transcriptional regulator of adaptative response / DNA-3-methyladenine glycosylase II